MLSIPKGYKFAVCCGDFRKEKRNDLALVVSETKALVAAVFTQNIFPAAPVLIAKQSLKNNQEARAVMINSGQANACTGEQGLANCWQTMHLLAKELDIDAAEILPASTGVIGAQFDMPKWQKAIPKLAQNLGQASPKDFTKAIMTTDAFMKIASRELELSTGKVAILGMAKGAGMICPNMATMLCTILCDAKISFEAWGKMLKDATELSFNRASVDGDTSTNDTIYALTNACGAQVQTKADEEKLYAGLLELMQELAYMLVQDGEGATKVLHICVSGAKTNAEAEQVARTVGHSPLVKTAAYGQDANWGRIIMAMGRAGVDFDPNQAGICFCGVDLFKNGQPTNIDFDTLLKDKIKERDLYIDITIGSGTGSYTLLASDLGHAYIDCNASYRS